MRKPQGGPAEPDIAEMRANRRVLCALSVLGVVVAGCGGKPFPSSAGASARLVSAVDTTVQAKTARVALAVSGSSGSESITEEGNGVIDFNTRALQLAVKVTIGGLSVDAELRELDGKIYTRSSSAGQSSEWRSVPSVAPAGASSENALDPRQFLSFLRGVAGDVRTVGKERVRDADTTHYAATIDLASLAARASSADDRDTSSAAQRVFGNMRSVPVDVWVDGKQRLRKFAMAASFDGQSAVSAGTLATVTMEFYDFGVPVHVEAPAGAQDIGARVQDRAVQSDLRNALTAEKTIYTDNQEYDSSAAHMKTIESSLDWGGKLKAYVGNATSINDIVCLEEQSPSGTIFSLADVADGPNAGTYYGTQPCPSPLTGQRAEELGSSWPGSGGGTGFSSGDGTSDGDTSTETTEPASGVLSVSGVERDLRNALTAEKTAYTDNQQYDAATADMKAIESSLDWGRTLKVTVGDAVNAGDKGVVCIWESTARGQVFAIADVAAGPKAGTYYGHTPCGEHPSAAIADFFTSSW